MSVDLGNETGGDQQITEQFNKAMNDGDEQ